MSEKSNPKDVLLNTLREDLGSYEQYKPIQPGVIQDLGYNFSGVHLNIKNKEGRVVLNIREIKDNDKPKRELDFCFVFSYEKKFGFLVNHPFKKYFELEEKALAK